MTSRESRPPESLPPDSTSTPRRMEPLAGEPAPAAPPGTLVFDSDERPRMFVIDYAPSEACEVEIASIDEVIPYLSDDLPSTTWVDIRGLGDRATFERLGEIFAIHPLALEDVVNAPQRPKSDVYSAHQVVIARMVQLDVNGRVTTEQVGILFFDGVVVTVQEEPHADVLDGVRERIRLGRGIIRSGGADYLAYAIIDAIIDGFYPVLEALGERLEDLELEVSDGDQNMSRAIHDIKRELLTVRRAIWPQRDLLNVLLREDSPHITKETRVYLRDTYDHAIQVMDMIETYREIASGLMDLYLSSVSNRMNEIMKVLTIISTIFLPLTFIAGVYGMNFQLDSVYNMPELKWRFGYLFALGLMGISVVILLWFYRKKGWLGGEKKG